ncbi:hypothetical protein RFI_05556, partial [Reticulomyxa filosa]
VKENNEQKKDAKFQEKAKDELKDVIDSKLEEELLSFTSSNDIAATPEYLKDSLDDSNDADLAAADDGAFATTDTSGDERQREYFLTSADSSDLQSSRPWLRHKPHWSEQSRSIFYFIFF